jgi:hypothetical protein
LLSINPPPISQPLSMILNNGESDLTTPIQASLTQVRKKFPNLKANEMFRIAFLSEIMNKGKNGLHAEMNIGKMKPLKKGYAINVSLKTDTVFKHTLIGRYPASNNTYYNDIDLEKMISEYIETNLDSILSDWKGEMSDDAYLIKDMLA